jgi:lysozyme
MYAGIVWPNNLLVSNYRVHGLDVSNHQKQIDWRSVAQTGEYTFVFIKATEGTTYKDAYFQANWRGAKTYGLLRGAYHFYIEYLSGAEQANNFISVVPKESGMLPPVLDLEVTGQDRTTMIREIKIFLDRLEQHYRMKPIIYTDSDRYVEYVKDNFEGYKIWMNATLLPIQWSGVNTWTFWQYCSRGRVSGITEFVDFNVFSGNRNGLDAMTKPSSA